MQSLPPAWDQILSRSNKDYTEIVECLRAQSAKIQNTPQEKWDEWAKAVQRKNQKGGGPRQNPPKSAPNLKLPLQKCYNCGQTGHKSTNCGVRQQQQQQQQQYRTQGTAPPAQNQNWGPSNQNYGNSQPNQSNMRNSGQSGSTGYGRGGNNSQGYNNNTRNSGNNNYQPNYSNPQRGQSNYPPNQQNRSANYGNRQPPNSYGVRAVHIDHTCERENEENGENGVEGEMGDLCGPDSYLPKNNSELENCNEQYEQNCSEDQMVYPNDGFAQNEAEHSVQTNEPEENVPIFSQIATQQIQENSTNQMLGNIMRKMEDLQKNQQDLQQGQRRTDSKLENFRGLNKTQGFRLSYEGGQIPQKNGERLQMNSDVEHSKSRASLGMHDIACECSECLLEKTTKIAQAKAKENFRVDASKNNRPNDKMLPRNVGGNNGIIYQNPTAPVQKRDFCESASYSNPPVEKSSLPQNPRAQQPNKDFCVDNSLSNVPQKIIDCCDKQNARHSNDKALETSVCHAQQRSEIMPEFGGRSGQLSLDSKQLLANPDNNNKPNENCYEKLHKDVQGEATAEVKSVGGTLVEMMGQVNQNLVHLDQKLSSKVEKVVTNVREMSDVLDHDIMKRDQESERVNRQLLESDKTTDRFRQETPTLNVFAAPKCGLRTEGHDWAPDPMIQALPIQCVKVPRFKVKV
ncbi:MAG: hypothetical protein GY820_34995, partial [Gammaproteobacteria bacterium]|nr:hypothetical protein [Gammaproteobacteria bacterium]